MNRGIVIKEKYHHNITIIVTVYMKYKIKFNGQVQNSLAFYNSNIHLRTNYFK